MISANSLQGTVQMFSILSGAVNNVKSIVGSLSKFIMFATMLLVQTQTALQEMIPTVGQVSILLGEV